MIEAVSHPAKAKISTDQKIMSLIWTPGVMECSVNEVAAP